LGTEAKELAQGIGAVPGRPGAATRLEQKEIVCGRELPSPAVVENPMIHPPVFVIGLGGVEPSLSFTSPSNVMLSLFPETTE
jgi:hypothetical protein